jgi:hypothetical protein
VLHSGLTQKHQTRLERPAMDKYMLSTSIYKLRA